MHISGIGVLACVFAAASFAAGAATVSPFDTPLKVVHIALPRDKDNPQAKREVRCSYYPKFMVKEIDLGEEGADQLSILHNGEGRICRRVNAPNEKIVSPDDWTGYFAGVSGDYVFFSADDGWNGGMGFAVFTPDAKKLFEDVEKNWTIIAAVAPPGPAGIDSGHGIGMRYTRVYGAKCSLAGAHGEACWERIRRDTGLQGPMPDCRADYAREQARTPKSPVLDDPTAVEYDVATTIAVNGVHETAVGPAPPKCRPQE